MEEIHATTPWQKPFLSLPPLDCNYEALDGGAFSSGSARESVPRVRARPASDARAEAAASTPGARAPPPPLLCLRTGREAGSALPLVRADKGTLRKVRSGPVPSPPPSSPAMQTCPSRHLPPKVRGGHVPQAPAELEVCRAAGGWQAAASATPGRPRGSAGRSPGRGAAPRRVSGARGEGKGGSYLPPARAPLCGSLSRSRRGRGCGRGRRRQQQQQQSRPASVRLEPPSPSLP